MVERGKRFQDGMRLQTPSVRAQLGFLYVSFRPNAGEFWEVHEVLRKLALMGALVLKLLVRKYEWSCKCNS